MASIPNFADDSSPQNPSYRFPLCHMKLSFTTAKKWVDYAMDLIGGVVLTDEILLRLRSELVDRLAACKTVLHEPLSAEFQDRHRAERQQLAQRQLAQQHARARRVRH